MVGQDAVYDSTFLKFTEVWFVMQHLIYNMENVVHVLEQRVCPGPLDWMVYKYQLSLSDLIDHLRSIRLRSVILGLHFSLDFLFGWFSIGVCGVFKAPTIIMLLLISLFRILAFALCIEVLLRWCIYIYNCSIFFLDWIPWSLCSILHYFA